jgi:hypothetical protein
MMAEGDVAEHVDVVRPPVEGGGLTLGRRNGNKGEQNDGGNESTHGRDEWTDSASTRLNAHGVTGGSGFQDNFKS